MNVMYNFIYRKYETDIHLTVFDTINGIGVHARIQRRLIVGRKYYTSKCTLNFSSIPFLKQIFQACQALPKA